MTLAACTAIVKVDGEQVIKNRMSLKLPEAWNKVQFPNDRQPFEVWTQEGIRFAFSMLRKSDDVQMLGMGWVAVKKEELFAATFWALKLSFFTRLQGKAESVVKSAQIKS